MRSRVASDEPCHEPEIAIAPFLMDSLGGDPGYGQRSVAETHSTLPRALHMAEPLSKSQQRLRGRKLTDMTIGQLRDWIDACDKMERWVTAAKARRGWKQSGQEAERELQRRDKSA